MLHVVAHQTHRFDLKDFTVADKNKTVLLAGGVNVYKIGPRLQVLKLVHKLIDLRSCIIQ